MTIKLSVGLQQKIGQPNYGSCGASCSLELPLEESLLADPAQLTAKIEAAYLTCRESIDRQLAQTQAAAEHPGVEHLGVEHLGVEQCRPDASGTGRGQQPSDPQSTASASQSAATPATQSTDPPVSRTTAAERPATAAQLRAIGAIAPKTDVLLNSELDRRYGLTRATELSLTQASEMIDYLKSRIVGQSQEAPAAPAR